MSAFVGEVAQVGEVTEDTGELGRFLALIERHTPALLKVTSALVGFADAEDAAQEAVVKAWQARAALRDPEKLRPWLLRIAVNVCREWRRGRFGLHQRLQQALPDDPEHALATLESDPGASDAAAGLDLREAINALDHDLRLIVVLRYYGGMDATEIGTALGVPAATVRTRLRRALAMLRLRLRDSGPQPASERREGVDMPSEDNTIPSPSPELTQQELDGMERQILADSAAWERHVPSPGAFNARLRRRLTEEHMREQEPVPLPSWLVEKTSDGESGPLPSLRVRPPSRTRTLLAGVAAVVIVGLLAAVFASLTHGRTRQGPAVSATATATAQGATATATATSALTMPAPGHLLAAGAAVTQQPGTPVVAPSDPNVIYEYADNGTGVVLRRSDDGGHTWHDLSYPNGGAFIGAIEVAVSPMDAHNVFLRLDLGYQPGTSNPCQALAETQHGGVLASGGLDCRVEFSSRDGGIHWTRIALPVAGELFQSGVTFAYDPTTIQAGGDRLYGRVWQLDANGTQTGDIRIASTRDGGQSWQVADASLARQAGHICAFSAAPGSATVFAIGSTTVCWANPAGARSVWRSDDDGAHWVRAGDLPVALTQPDASFIAASEGGAADATAMLFGIPGPAATAGAVEVLASSDSGQTWHAVPSKGLPAGALILGVGGTPLADGSIVVMVNVTTASGQQAGASAGASAGATATPAEPGAGAGQQSGAIGYVWTAGGSSWRQVTPRATINGAGISNIFVSNGARLVVTLSIADDMTSNPTYTLERFE